MIKPIKLAKIIFPLLLVVVATYIFFNGVDSPLSLAEWFKGERQSSLDNTFILMNPQEEEGLTNSASGLLLEEKEGEGEVFPASLGEMTLTKALKGEEAVNNIREIHGDEIDIYNAYIPYYQGKDQQAVIWISEFREISSAKSLIRRIDDRVPEREVFKNYSSWVEEDTVVYQVEGMGWYNFYYQKENRVYWVCIQGEEPREIFKIIFETL